MKNTSHRVNAIIPHYQSPGELHECIRSLMKGNLVPDRILVVNSGPADEKLEKRLEEYVAIELIQMSENRGFAAAVNAGAQKADGEMLLICNPDVVFEEDTLEILVAALQEEDRRGIVGPLVHNSDGSVQESARAFPKPVNFFFNRRSIFTRLFPGNRFSQDYLQGDSAPASRITDWLSACCILVRKEIFEEVEGFDENYFLFMEDVDFCHRIAETSRPERWYCTYASVVHAIGVSNKLTDIGLINKRHDSIRYYVINRMDLSPPVQLMARGAVFMRRCLMILIAGFRSVFAGKKK